MPSQQHKSGRTLFALGLGYLVDQGESQAIGVLNTTLQAVYRGLATDASIGLMETLRTIMQTVSAPFWGYAADKFSRKNVLIFGTGVWGIWTILVGLLLNFNSIFIVRVISGLGLGALMPATFSLLGDHYSQDKRGRALGVIGFVGLMGTVLGVVALGFVANEQLWRWGFIGLGIASMLSGLLIWLFVQDLPRGSAEPEIADLIDADYQARYTINVRDMLATLRIPTIWAAILQGVSGSMPWVVMSLFMLKWMEETLGYSKTISFSDPRGSAPLTFALIVVGAAISNFLGGVIGDKAEKISPKYGRTAIGQFSVFIGVPLLYIILTKGPQMSFGAMLATCFTTALLIGWPGRGAKEPMMQAVVPPEMRSSAYSVVNLIEGGLSAFSGAICGAISVATGSLTTAMLWTVPFPWVLCTLFFTLFYFTYPRDAAKVRRLLAERRAELLAGRPAPTHAPAHAAAGSLSGQPAYDN